MQTHTITITTYSFDELSDDAKQRAIEQWRTNTTEIDWAEENKDTLNAFCGIFPIDVTDWEYGYRNIINCRMTTEYDEIDNLTGIRLLKYLSNNYWDKIYKGKYYSTGHPNYKSRRSNCQFESICPLTGYCMDESILEPIHTFMKQPNDRTTLKQLLYECLQSWIQACAKDYEWQQSDKYITDTIQANDYEFTEDGKRY
jgi:hypothetical protein